MLAEFDLELYFAKWEFNAKYMLGSSDSESMKMKDLLSLADDECINLWNDLSCSYTESDGMQLLREEIAKNYDGLNYQNIFCFAGAEEGIYTAMRTMLNKDDHAVIITPCYQSLMSVADAICGSVTCVDLELNKNKDEWKLNLSTFESSIKSNTKMVIMNFPHNPTGALLTKDEQLKVVEICRKHNIILFFDEVYRGIEDSSDLQLPPLASIYENGLSLGVMSKALGLAGLRIGWIASQSMELINKLAGYKHYLSICNSGPSEILSLIALRNQKQILKKNFNIVQNNLKILSSFMEKHGDIFEFIPPKGGCCGLMKYKGSKYNDNDDNNGDWLKHSEYIVKNHSVLTIPGVFFSFGDISYKSSFRLGIGRENFPEALAIFEEAVQVYLR